MYFQTLATAPDLRADELCIATPVGSAGAGLQAACSAALRREYADLPLSERGGTEYGEIRRNRRSDLEALLRAGITPETRTRAADVACAICEESRWARDCGADLGDEMHPDIDLFAAETASLMAWCANSGTFDARTRARMVYELRRRIFTPIIAHDDYPFMTGAGEHPLGILCAALSAAVLAEGDQSRLYTFLRRAAKIADTVIDLEHVMPLRDALAEYTAATALWLMARKAAGPSAMARALPKPAWLDEMLMASLGAGVFADPAGEGTVRDVNGADIFFMGHAAGDGALEALGATLYREHACEASCVNARMQADFSSEMIKNMDPVPRLRHAALPGGRMMSVRGGGLMALMHAGGRSNAGDICLYVENTPVIVTRPGGAPVVNGVSCLDDLGVGDCDFGEERADMSMDMTLCYPGAAKVRFYQRTFMLNRQGGVARMIDVIETDAAGKVEYAFATPYAPARLDGGARMGLGLMTWDCAGEADVTRIAGSGAFADGLYLVKIECPLNPGSNIMNFVIERA